MKYCLDCKTEFEEPAMIETKHFEVDEPNTEFNQACPVCGSTDIEEMHQCHTSSDWIRSSEDYCGDCINSGLVKISELAIMLDIGIEDAKDLLMACMEERYNEK